MTTRHKHADLIIAWANGAEIEYSGSRSSGWIMATAPSWQEDVVYRIKTKPEPVYPSATSFYHNGVHIPSEIVAAALKRFVESGMLARYVEKHGVDGLKNQ